MKINIFKTDSPLFAIRWLIIILFALTGWLTYSNLTGNRMLVFSEQEEWKSEGPVHHK